LQLLFVTFIIDEEKTAGEDAESTDTGQEQGSTEGLVRNEIKTVAEETSNAQVAVKRPLDIPPGLENETKKRRVELPFMQKGNRGNEMDILDALQGNLSSPSPTPSPDIWSTAKTFEIPPASSVPHVTPVHSTEEAASSKSTAKTEQKKAVVTEKLPLKKPDGKPKSSPKKKVKAPKKTTSPVTKSASPKISTPTKIAKEKSPSLMKSPLADKTKSATPEIKKKTTPKKEKKPTSKAKKPVVKSTSTTTAPPSAKENVMVKESMPKLIIKPIVKEANKEPQFSVKEFLPPGDTEKQEKPQQKKSKNKDSTSKKQKPRKEKKAVIPSVKKESTEWSASSTSEGLKFSISKFALAPPVGVSGETSLDPALEHKKKKKKRKEKDKDKEKRKDKSKKLKTDHREPPQTSSFATPPIPRITVKLEPPSHSTSVTNKAPSKAEPSPMALGSAGNQMVGSSSPTSPKLSVKQEPSVTSAVERTVVSQTLSQTFVHGGYDKVYYCPVCSDPDDGSLMIGCDGCEEWFHGRCVGILDDPGDVDWFCSSCLAKKDKDSKDKQKKKKKKKSKEKEK